MNHSVAVADAYYHLYDKQKKAEVTSEVIKQAQRMESDDENVTEAEYEEMAGLFTDVFRDKSAVRTGNFL